MNYVLVKYRLRTMFSGDSQVSEIYGYEFITDPSDLPEWHSEYTMDTQWYIHHDGFEDKVYHTLIDWDKCQDFRTNKSWKSWIWRALITNLIPLIRKDRIKEVIK